MAASFNTSVGLLENELTQLILDGQISARIDSRKKVRIFEMAVFTEKVFKVGEGLRLSKKSFGQLKNKV